MLIKEAKNRIRKVNDQFFSEWNKDSAYLLGYLEADGYFKVDQETLRVQFSVSIKDIEFLERLHKAVGFDGKVTTKTHYIKDGTHKTASFTVSSRQWKKDLKGKYRVGRIPSCITKELLPHYVRGYFDGDGSIFWSTQAKSYHSNFVSSNKEFLEDLAKKLRDQVGSKLTVYAKTSSKHCWYINLPKAATWWLCRYLYIHTTAHICLVRKRYLGLKALQ